MTLRMIILLAALAVIVLVGATTISRLQSNNAPASQSSPQALTLTGETVCLPVKNPDQPHSEVCTIGLKTDAGRYYELQSQDAAIFETGKRISATGIIVSPDPSSIYTIEDTLLVSTYLPEINE